MRIGRETVERANEFVEELRRRGVKLEVVKTGELVDWERRDKWVWT